MYKCHVEKRILGDRPETKDYTALCYELKITHAPILGQELTEKRWFSGPVIHILWNAQKDCFYVRVPDEKPHLRGTEEFSHDWLVDNYKQQGWVDCPQELQRID